MPQIVEKQLVDSHANPPEDFEHSRAYESDQFDPDSFATQSIVSTVWNTLFDSGGEAESSVTGVPSVDFLPGEVSVLNSTHEGFDLALSTDLVYRQEVGFDYLEAVDPELNPAQDGESGDASLSIETFDIGRLSESNEWFENLTLSDDILQLESLGQNSVMKKHLNSRMWAAEVSSDALRRDYSHLQLSSFHNPEFEKIIQISEDRPEIETEISSLTTSQALSEHSGKDYICCEQSHPQTVAQQKSVNEETFRQRMKPPSYKRPGNNVLLVRSRRYRHPTGELVLQFEPTKRKRMNRKKIDVGNNKYGRKGKLKCDACRNRRSKCVFVSENIACNFCSARNISPCIRRWGEKKEEQISRSMLTEVDPNIRSQDVLLLQYAYSNIFEGTAVGHLFKKMASIFHTHINDITLREAILAFAGSYLPSDSAYQRSEYHSQRVGRVLMTKYHIRFAEPDLLATGLLAFLYGLRSIQDKFNVYLRILISIMQKIAGEGENNRSLVTFPLWPILREMIIEASRFINETSSDLVLQFCQKSRIAIGEHGFSLRPHDMKEFFGIESREVAFYWYFYGRFRLLRKIFRFVVGKECGGEFERDEHTISMLSEVINYLNSKEVMDFINRIIAGKIAQNAEQHDPGLYGRTTFTLILYRMCILMSILIQGPTIVSATSSVKAVSAAMSLLELIRAEHVPSIIRYPGRLENDIGSFPRILCIAGLQFPKSTYPERNVLQSLSDE